MNSPLPAPAPAPRRNWTRLLVNLLVALAVIAVAAAAFVFSYAGVQAIALLGGMSRQLARYYPGLFDAVLVIACVAAVMHRDGRWWARLWAWVVALVVLAAIGGADVLHAISFTLPHRTTEAIVAAAPVVAVLLAFSLLLTLIRPSRMRAPEPALTPLLEVPALPAAGSAAPIALPAAPTVPVPAAATVPAVPAAAAAPAAATAPPAAVPMVPVPAEAGPGAEDSPAPAAAPTRAAPVVDTAPEVPPPGPRAAGAAGEPDEPGEPAPPTVAVPALPSEPAPSSRSAAEGSPTRERHGIRYAGSGVPGVTGTPPAAKDDTELDEEYWDTGEGEPLAGLVYRAREDRADADDAGNSGTGAAGGEDAGAAENREPAARTSPPELDDDAPPFATAPYAAAPRLNRVRSTPIPPADEDE